MKKIVSRSIRASLLLFVMLAFTACKTDEQKSKENGDIQKEGNASSRVTDRDGNTYGVIQIGDQVWMSENLKVDAKDSWCYDESQENCNRYGRLYTWDAAMKACPDGWSLPSNEDWETLKSFAEGKEGRKKAGKALKVGGVLGFNAPLAGDKAASKFQLLDKTGYYWSSTDDDISHAYDWVFFDEKDDLITGNIKYSLKQNGLSVRCIKKEQSQTSPSASGSFTDDRDGKTYKVVKIGGQRWFAENLAYKTSKSKCSSGFVYTASRKEWKRTAKSCEKYGSLYTWLDAMQIPDSYAKKTYRSKGNVRGVCPDGWHLPSYAEWETLLNNVETKVPKAKVWAALLSKDEAFVDYFVPSHDESSPEKRMDVKGFGNVRIGEKGSGYYYERTRGTDVFGFNARVIEEVQNGDAEDDGGVSLTAFWTSTDETEEFDYKNYIGNASAMPSVDSPENRAQFLEEFFFPVRCIED